MNLLLTKLYVRKLVHGDVIWSQDLGNGGVQVWAIDMDLDTISLIIEMYENRIASIR